MKGEASRASAALKETAFIEIDIESYPIISIRARRTSHPHPIGHSKPSAGLMNLTFDLSSSPILCASQNLSG